MQRGGSAACRLREFGDMDLDTTVQEVEAESKHAVDGDLPHPWDMQRNEDEPGCGKCAAVTTPRKAKNAAIVTINPNEPRIANTPRQPSRSPMTPAMEEPTRLPVRPTASSRPMATWR